jgi:hypothetical protein
MLTALTDTSDPQINNHEWFRLAGLYKRKEKYYWPASASEPFSVIILWVKETVLLPGMKYVIGPFPLIS